MTIGQKNPVKSIDRGLFFQYNITMATIKRSKTEYLRLILRIILPIACALVLAFIFSNSLKTGEASSAQSSKVVDAVQAVFGVIAPNSSIATATGEDYQRLHACIRLLAHFAEFALLGALFAWCCLSYTTKKAYFIIPTVGVLTVPCIDEGLQSLTAERAAEWKDILVDGAGGICGLIFAVLCVLVGVAVYKKIKANKSEARGID